MTDISSISAATPAPAPARASEDSQTAKPADSSQQQSGEQKSASVYNTVQSASNSTIRSTGVNVVV